MQGLQALMQRGLMPGQAGAFSALPQQQGRNPIAYTKSLKQLKPEELLSMYNDPNDLRPKWAVASAYADAVKAKALNEGAEGQMAMAQNAQQQRPVVDEMMSTPLAMGGQVKSYQFGGDIESNDFDDVFAQVSPLNADMGTPGISSEQLATERELSRREKIRERYRNAFIGGFEGTIEKLFREEPWLQAEMRPNDVKTAPSQQSSNSAGAQASAAPPVTVVPPGPSANPPTGLPAARNAKRYDELLETDVEALSSLLKQRSTVPEEVKTGRQRVADLRAAQIQQAQEDARRIRETGVARLQKSLDSARAPVINDPMALLSIASSIDPEKGKLFQSLPRGIYNVLAERRDRAEKAEQGIETLSEKIRLLNAQYREAQALEAQRQQALLEGDVQTARNAEIEAAKLRVDMRRTQASIQAARMEAAAKQEAAGASREAANATRQANLQNRVTIALQNRQNAFQKAKEDWSKGTDVKLAAMKASSPNAKEEDVKRWEDMQKAFETAFRNSSEIMALDAAIASMSREAGIPPPISRSDWGQEVKVTDTPKQ